MRVVASATPKSAVRSSMPASAHIESGDACSDGHRRAVRMCVALWEEEKEVHTPTSTAAPGF